MDVFIHPTAIVDQPVTIGKGSKIWHFSHVMSGAELGENCNLGQNVFVAGGVRIGDGCKIQNNVSLYDGVELGPGVFCGPSMVFTNVRTPRAEIVRRGQYEKTVVERGVTFGANCTVVCGTRIGRYAFIAAGAVVTRDVPAFALMAGAPARRIGWAGRRGLRLQPVAGEPGAFCCPESGERYLEIEPERLVPAEEAEGMKMSGAGAAAAQTLGAAPPGEPDDAPILLLDLQAQHAELAEAIEPAVLRVVRSQRFILGEEVEAFERETAAWIAGQSARAGARAGAVADPAAEGELHAIGCASGTDALLLALMALDLAPGDEVITTPYSFFATAGSIVRLGLRPVFCDIDPLTHNIDPALIENLITPRTRAIMPVHLYGQCAAMEALLQIASKHRLAVIEDACQSIGARDAQGRAAGTIGTIGCFSFFPSKNLGGYGDGGLITTRDGALAARLRRLRVHGAAERYLHEEVGINSRLDALQAAVLRVKLPRLESWCMARAANAARYGELLAAAGLLSPEPALAAEGTLAPPPAPEIPARHVFNQYVIRLHESQREPLRHSLARRRVGTAIYYPVPLHLQPCFATLGGREGDCPQAERASRETLALPIYPELGAARQAQVVSRIEQFLTRADARHDL